MMIERDPGTGRFVTGISTHMTGKQMRVYYDTLRDLRYAINKARTDIAWVCSKQK